MSDKDQIFQELQGYIVEQLGVEKEKVTMTAAFIEDLNADSLDLVEFAMGLEEKFGVTIADEELTKIKDNPSLVKQFFKHPTVAYITDL